jgi:hypothetical protein
MLAFSRAGLGSCVKPDRASWFHAKRMTFATALVPVLALRSDNDDGSHVQIGTHPNVLLG